MSFRQATFLQKRSSSMLWKNNGTSRCLDIGTFRFPVTSCVTRCSDPTTRWDTRSGSPTRDISGKFDVAWVGFYEWRDKCLLVKVKGWHVNNIICMILRGCRGVLWMSERILCSCVIGSIFICIFVQGCRCVWCVCVCVLLSTSPCNVYEPWGGGVTTLENHRYGIRLCC